MSIFPRYNRTALVVSSALLLLVGAAAIISINKKPSDLETIKVSELNKDFVEVDGLSMEPTFHNGDIVYYYTDFSKEDVKRGTVIIFSNTKEDNSLSIKRVVATEGTVSIKDNVVYVDGLRTPYGFESTYTDYYFRDNSWKVSPNSVFVIGDNYGNSIDSRSYGSIPLSSIVGIVKE